MKLLKKAAAGLLAAAMALFMLTACGPSSGGGSAPANKPGNGGGNNTAVLEPVPGPDKTEDGSEQELQKTPITDRAKSRYDKFAKTVSEADEFYLDTVLVKYNASGAKTSESTMVVARKGNDIYIKMKDASGVDTLFEHGETDGKYTDYILFEDSKNALEATPDGSLASVVDKLGVLPTTLYATSVKVSGKTYYAETYIDEKGSENIECFGDELYPIYEFTKKADGTSSTSMYRSVLFNSKNLCTINGYTVYEQKGISDTERKLIDTTHDKEYTVTLTRNSNNKITGVKVFDSNKNDVSKQFDWYVTFLTT